MQDDLIRVRTGTLRGAADQLAVTGYRLGHGLAGVTGSAGPPLPAAPTWAATTALAALESAVHDWLTGIGGRAAATADGLRTAADGYDTADDRAAIRLGGGPR
ncbi:type VII secretion target [Micromonospora sp. NPDC049523]|uniref:type VII secretion target n=1 Tax=Micromonospora sp. NPDC049523 TaxID=3155921 RepID=UPI00341C77FA